MTGIFRVAAKVLLGTTVLAAGGGGGYYYTTNGFTLPASLQSKSAPSTEDLAAVASAWSELPKSEKYDSSLSSPIARSAKPEVVEAAAKATKELSNDRYAQAAAAAKAETASEIKADVASEEAAEGKQVETPAVAATEQPAAEKAAEALEPEPTQVVEVEPVVAAATDDNKEPTPVIASPAAEKPVARGQEPKDEPAGSLDSSTADLEATLNAAGGATAGLAEPKPLTPPAQSSDISAANSQAKAAFNSPPAAGMNDRYGGSAAAAGGSQAAPNNGQIVNPFSAKPQPTPASKNELIEPLPPRSIDGNDSFANGSELQPMQAPSTASSMNRDLQPMTREMPPAKRSLSSAPRNGMGAAYDRSPQPSNNNLMASPEPITPIQGGDGIGKPGEKALEGAQQPTLVIQKYAPAEIQVGKPAKFVLQVRNASSQSADDVTIRDEIPQGTKLISTAPNAANEGGAIVWKLGKLSPGEDRTVEMQLMPVSEGEIGSVATVSYSAQASVKTKCTMPQLAIRMTAANEVMVGKQQHVKIEIKNPGTGDATHVILLENVPPNVKHAAGPALEFEIGTLRAGETRELDLVLTAEKAGKVVNALTARADGNLQVQQQVEFEVIAPALMIDVDGPERRYLERPATYAVSVANPGTASAHDVQIVTKLPKGMKFVRANNMGEYDAATHAVYWSLAELPKGEKGTVELVAMPTETGQQTLQVEGHAQQGLTDHKQRDITVEGLAAIMFEVRDLEDPIEVGGETGYEIRVVNQGTKAATNVQVTCEIPPGLKVLSAEGEAQHKVMDGRLVFEPLQQLAPKADTVYRIRAQGVQAGDQRINVQVNTDDLQQPIRREESTRVFGDQ